MKNIISVLLAVSLVFGSAALAFAETKTDAKLYNIYGNDMLFQQNEKAVLSGTAKSGSKISCKVYKGDILYAQATSVSDGEFEVGFDAPAGGYDEYTIKMYQDGNLFDTLTGVVFGELWIAGGQSNMHLFLRYTATGMEMMKNSQYGSKNIRVLDMPLVPSYSGDMSLISNNSTQGYIPVDPQTDIEGANWFSADCEKVYDITGVGYLFAEKLQKELDMPVGILCNYLGGSSILPWLSRTAIDSDSQVKSDMGSKYIEKSKWTKKEINVYTDMSSLYNIKTAPLTVFHVAGMIWYQGESDSTWEYGRYTRAITLLQNSLTEDFDYTDGKMPIILSAFADNNLTGNNTLRFLSAELGEFVKADYTSRSLITISDVSLEYTTESQAVHPIDKKPVGERMADAACELVYGKDVYATCSPILRSSEISGNAIYLTFDNVGDGLVFEGNKINGFTVCGKNGVYLPADAEIVDKDTVKVSNATVTEPVAAMYSQGLITERSNLFSSVNGVKALPVNHSITDRDYTENVWQDFGWTDCDSTQMWRHQSYSFAGYFDVWKGENATAEITPNAAYSGNAGLQIKSTSSEFSVAPITECFNTASNETETFTNWQSDWQNFTSVSLQLKNTGNSDVTFEGIKIYVSDSKYYMPTVNGTDSVNCTVPADGEWHAYTFDLCNLYLNGRKSFISFTRKCLDDVTDVSFCFSGDTGAELAFDDIAFTSYKYNASSFRIFGFDFVELFSKIFGNSLFGGKTC